MHTFAQKHKPALQTKSANFAKRSRSRLGQRSEVRPILNLHRTIGNQAVQRLLEANAEEVEASSATTAPTRYVYNFSRIPLQGRLHNTIQPKLTISTPGDVYEQEADRVADKVMRMPETRLQRACACGGGCPKCQTEQSNQEHERLQTMTVSSTDLGQTAVQPIVHEVRRSPGRPLDSATRDFMEPRFGRDFSNVRIHSDGQAAEAARSVNARAYTTGTHVVFGKGQYQPGTDGGRKLLAHELTHIIQQTGAGAKKIDQSNVSVEPSPIGVQPMIQRDLAIAPPRPAAVGRVLTPAQMADAIAFNNRVLGSIANSADIIEMIRDVIGVSKLPAVVDADFVNGVVLWQANFGLTQDGQLGPATARPLFREIGAEGVGRAELRRNPRYAPAGPINVPRAGVRVANFGMSAEFRSDPANHVFPSCGEIRQDIQWDAAFVAASVAAGNGSVPHAGFPAAHPANRWIEDRNATDTLRYGHRAAYDRGPGNRYLDTMGRQNQAFGHRFEGSDSPQGLAADRGSWRFRLRAIDVCNGNQLLAVSPTLVLNWL